MKKSDLYREYARIIDMCEGTDVKPAYCMKYIFTDMDTSIPYHNNGVVMFTHSKQQDPSKFIFALAIVEGRPVFKYDLLWHPHYRVAQTVWGVGMFSGRNNEPASEWSWNPPKSKTITITLLREDVERVLVCLDRYQVPVAIERARAVIKEALK